MSNKGTKPTGKHAGENIFQKKLRNSNHRGMAYRFSTPDAVAGSILAFSTCLFHVVPRVLGCAADEKTGPVVLYGQIKPVLIVSIYSFIWAQVRL